MLPLLRHRNPNGNGVSWLLPKTWKSLRLSRREYFGALVILRLKVI